MRPTWGPPGSCRPQMGLMLAPWTLLWGHKHLKLKGDDIIMKCSVMYWRWLTGQQYRKIMIDRFTSPINMKPIWSMQMCCKYSNVGRVVLIIWSSKCLHTAFKTWNAPQHAYYIELQCIGTSFIVTRTIDCIFQNNLQSYIIYYICP